jgi:hypothetical protein
MDKNLDHAIEAQEKFDYYFIALIFSMLGLSIQTAKFSDALWSNAAEWFGWVCLLISGLSGLFRIELTHPQFKLVAKKNALEREEKNLDKLRENGVNSVPVFGSEDLFSVNDLILNKQTAIGKVDKLLGDINRKTGIMLKMKRRLFIAGVILIFLSRSEVPIIKIYSAISPKTSISNDRMQKAQGQITSHKIAVNSSKKQPYNP